VGQLAGGIAHDLNNMLAAIRASLDLLPRPAPETEGELEIIEQAAERATKLTGQLLAFAHRQELDVAPVALNGLLTDLAPMLRRAVHGRVLVWLELNPEVDLVRTDRSSLEQALVNMAINASDAMPRAGALTLSTRNVVLGPAEAAQRSVAPGAYACVSVSDTGTGMPAEVRERIFEPFFTTKKRGAGTGLGLSMAYAFVRQSGGQIEVDSDIGRGSTFRIYLPKASPDALVAVTNVESVPSGERSITSNGGETLLLVDDEPLVLTAMQHLLEAEGYRVLTADAPAVALDLARAEASTIRLVITDFMLPGLTGAQLAWRLAELGLEAPVLCTSGYSDCDEPWPKHVEFVRKPFEPRALCALVRTLLDTAASSTEREPRHAPTGTRSQA